MKTKNISPKRTWAPVPLHIITFHHYSVRPSAVGPNIFHHQMAAFVKLALTGTSDWQFMTKQRRQTKSNVIVHIY